MSGFSVKSSWTRFVKVPHSAGKDATCVGTLLALLVQKYKLARMPPVYVLYLLYWYKSTNWQGCHLYMDFICVYIYIYYRERDR
jgi:hypothetical protein